MPWLALLLATLATYLFGLGGFYAPTNGDEMVYMHIARRTAESGHWLPLVSDLAGMRNTKPPLLFWQALLAGDWGQHWSLWALRLPSICYTFACTGLITWLTRRICGNWRTGLLAGVVYLLFFSTFRYGRVYLTSAPETFWLSLPMFWVLWRVTGPSADPAPWGWRAYTAIGLVLGIGLAYKSFALLAPSATCLWLALLATQTPLSRPKLLRTTLGMAASGALALAIFALWFALDPNPAAVWQEFVIGENAGKMGSQGGYWHNALRGDYPIWAQLLAFPENAGLLGFIVLGLVWLSARSSFPALRRSPWQTLQSWSPATQVLLLWLAVWLVVFCIPSQRSARYVVAAMPALAMLLALHWPRIARGWFLATLLLTAPALVMLARIAASMHTLGISDNGDLALACTVAAIGLIAISVGFLRSRWTRSASLVACLCVYASFNAMVEPLGATANQYSTQLVQQLAGKRVAVPNGFNGQYERFHFALPHSTIRPYDAEGRNTGSYDTELPPAQRLDWLLTQADAVVWLQDDLANSQPSCAPRCQVLGQRWHVKSRHQHGEVTLDNIWHPEQWLFRREWLVASITPAKSI